MADPIDKKRYEQNFRDIFSKINKLLPISAFSLIMTILIAFWGSLFGLLHADIQNFKREAMAQRIEVIKELGEVKILSSKIKK